MKRGILPALSGGVLAYFKSERKDFTVKRFAPPHFIRILAVAGLLSVVLFASYATFHRLTAHACSNYHVSGATSLALLNIGSAAFTGEIELWYNSCTGYNTAKWTFTQFSWPNGVDVEVVGGSSGLQGDHVMCYSGTCTTPIGVYSPNYPARACMLSGGIPNIEACTDWF